MEKDLCLREVRLRPSEPWMNPEEGLWFVFPKAGTGEFVNGSVRHWLSAKAALVANVGRLVTTVRAAAPEFCFQYFQMGLETVFPLMTCSEIPKLRAVADGFKIGKSYPAAHNPAARCIEILERVPAEENLEHRTLLLQTAAVLLAHELQALDGMQLPAGSAGERVRQLLEGISSTDLENASVDELAQKFGYSRRHLNRLFRAQFGFSVGALRMEVRLLKATRLLRDPQAKVINVAAEAGFNNNLSLFNSCFRRRFGLSPSQWRKTMLNPNAEPTFNPVPTPLPVSMPIS